MKSLINERGRRINKEMKTYDKFTISHECGCQYYIDNNNETEQTELCPYHLQFIIKIKSLWRGEQESE